MTRNETIDGILNEMTLKIWSAYYELFSKHFKLELVKTAANEYESKAVLDLMVSNKLVRILNTVDKADVFKLTIELTEKGFKIKESGGWLAYMERRRNRVDKFFRIIAGIESIVIIVSIAVGLYIQENTKTLTRQQKQLTQKVKADSLRIIDLDRLLKVQGLEIEKIQRKDSMGRPQKLNLNLVPSPQ